MVVVQVMHYFISIMSSCFCFESLFLFTGCKMPMLTKSWLILSKEPQAQSHRDCDQQERILQDRLYVAFQRYVSTNVT